MSSFSGIGHVALVVRDLATSVEWYGRVLGFEPVSGVEPGPPGEGHPRQLLRDPGSGVVIGLHEPVERSGDAFDPSRTGLDHVALTVADRSALDAWGARLAGLDVDRSPVRDAGYADFISVFDPDGVQWELWAQKEPQEETQDAAQDEGA